MSRVTRDKRFRPHMKARRRHCAKRRRRSFASDAGFGLGLAARTDCHLGRGSRRGRRSARGAAGRREPARANRRRDPSTAIALLKCEGLQLAPVALAAVFSRSPSLTEERGTVAVGSIVKPPLTSNRNWRLVTPWHFPRALALQAGPRDRSKPSGFGARHQSHHLFAELISRQTSTASPDRFKVSIAR